MHHHSSNNRTIIAARSELQLHSVMERRLCGAMSQHAYDSLVIAKRLVAAIRHSKQRLSAA
jgi:hypothetical protein